MFAWASDTVDFKVLVFTMCVDEVGYEGVLVSGVQVVTGEYGDQHNNS